MRVEIEKPDTIMFSVFPNQDEDMYHQCMWARITFDLKNWSMTCQSDCGDYSYSWCVEHGKRTFLQLMAQISEDYLLGKISEMSQFDAKATKENVIEWVQEDNDLSSSEKDELIKEINDIGEYCDAKEFLQMFEYIEGMKEYADLWECIEKDYPAGAKTFAKLFVEIIQPEIRKYLEKSEMT